MIYDHHLSSTVFLLSQVAELVNRYILFIDAFNFTCTLKTAVACSESEKMVILQ